MDIIDASRALMYGFSGHVRDWPRHNYRPTLRIVSPRTPSDRESNKRVIRARAACDFFGLAWIDGNTGESVNGAAVNAEACAVADNAVEWCRIFHK